MSKIKRVFHRYEKCEEYQSNMWKAIPIEQRQEKQEYSRNLMIEHDAFFDACMLVIGAWPYSCEAALTASTMNHQAWIGHAACAYNHGAPEDITRLAWRELTEEQQDLANAAADRAILNWKENYLKGLNNA